MKTKIEQTVDTKTVTTLHLKSKDIREMLAKAGHKVPKDAYIHIMVPGGSDWSNTDLGARRSLQCR